MPVSRKNCIVLDTSILPKRPSVSDIKKFLDEELKLDMSVVRSVQPHNVKNVVYLGLHNEEVATRIASEHHLKHFMECDGIKLNIPLPIYIESNAVDVRLHDLPEEFDNATIANHMRQYGEVIGIRNEVWKSYFPGLSNGVRVIRMQLKHPVPSYITIEQETTLVTHPQQIRTCKNCGNKSHPQLRCFEANQIKSTKPQKSSKAIDRPSQQNTHTNIPQPQPNTKNEEQWPSLSTPPPTKGGQSSKQKSEKTETKRPRSEDSDSSSSEEQNAKKTTAAGSSDSDSSSIAVSSTPAGNGWRRSTYPHIEDEELRRELMEEDDRRIKELLEQGYRL